MFSGQFFELHTKSFSKWVILLSIYNEILQEGLRHGWPYSKMDAYDRGHWSCIFIFRDSLPNRNFNLKVLTLLRTATRPISNLVMWTKLRFWKRCSTRSEESGGSNKLSYETYPVNLPFQTLYGRCLQFVTWIKALRLQLRSWNRMKILCPKQLFPKVELGTSMPFIFPATELLELWPDSLGLLGFPISVHTPRPFRISSSKINKGKFSEQSKCYVSFRSVLKFDPLLKSEETSFTPSLKTGHSLGLAPPPRDLIIDSEQ